MNKTILFDGDPRDSPSVAAAVAGAETLIHMPVAQVPRRIEDFDRATRGMYVLATEAVKAGVKHIILCSSLAFFGRIPQNWHLGTNWRPRPSTELDQLCPYLSELSLQEVARATGLHVTVLRLGAEVQLREALLEVAAVASIPWRIVHRGSVPGRPASDHGKSWRTILGPVAPVASRPIQKVAVLGAGGPIGRVVADVLKDHYTLRLADLHSLLEAKSQSPDAPLAQPLPLPHEEVFLDVRDFGSVLAACNGCDAIINLTVVRPDFIEAFLVNSLGAYNIGRAAAQLGIRRVVQTGPQLITLHGENDFTDDFHLACDSPTRPGRYLYGHSKFLGNEALRVFAEWHDLEVPNVMFNGFAQPDAVSEHGSSAMMLSWQDAARAIKCALEVPSLPSPYEEFHCVADFPHDQCRTDKAERLLGWKPQDTLEGLWRR
ncbi:NAD-dependent epimerase/dehydratase family protein [Armatimonas sp.]|uniref:NAD-dependent epimerase/dehydratase family protein n=1 Tax=Armatimonas sp. TaxID=1872638 RepID=UPI003750AE90